MQCKQFFKYAFSGNILHKCALFNSKVCIEKYIYQLILWKSR